MQVIGVLLIFVPVFLTFLFIIGICTDADGLTAWVLIIQRISVFIFTIVALCFFRVLNKRLGNIALALEELKGKQTDCGD